jgi:hypothetical protein
MLISKDLFFWASRRAFPARPVRRALQSFAKRQQKGLPLQSLAQIFMKDKTLTLELSLVLSRCFTEGHVLIISQGINFLKSTEH